MTFLAFELKGVGPASKQSLYKVDPVGSFLSIIGTTFFLMPLSWGGILIEWNAPGTVLLLVLGSLTLIVAACWEVFAAAEPFMRHVSLALAPFGETCS